MPCSPSPGSRSQRAFRAASRWSRRSSALSAAPPRTHPLPTAGGKLVACGALEQKFWESFCATIDLPQEFVDDTRDPKATIEAVRAIIASETAAHWKPLFAKADC